MIVTQAALYKRLGKRAHFKGIERNMEAHICDIDFYIE